MILQVLSDCTITIRDPASFYMLGPGELLSLPVHLATQVVIEAPSNFKIVKPIPLIPGVAVRWLLPDDTTQGPGIVQLVDGTHPTRRIAVLLHEELRWIHEGDVLDVDPWPAIDEKIAEAGDGLLTEGIASRKIAEVREWILTHFGED